MNGKSTEIVLENTAAGVTQSFGIDHAERLLRMPNNGGWKLPDDSEYKFDFNNGIGIKGDSRKATKQKENSGHNEG